MATRKLISLVSLVLFAVACSKQGEGERCNIINNSQDCEDGLTCLPPSGNDVCETANATYNCKPYRCCPQPQQGQPITDNRCVGYGNSIVPITGTGGSSAGGSDAGLAGSSAGGSSSVGGQSSAGGSATTGGETSGGGSTANGGATGTGGTSSNGGSASIGGTSSSGGATTSGT